VPPQPEQLLEAPAQPSASAVGSQRLADLLYSQVTGLDLANNPLGVLGAKTVARLLNPLVSSCPWLRGSSSWLQPGAAPD
jgi:hypothetical protein